MRSENPFGPLSKPPAYLPHCPYCLQYHFVINRCLQAARDEREWIKSQTQQIGVQENGNIRPYDINAENGG